MNFNKKMNRGGGVTLPSALRREYGLEAGEKFNVSVNQEGHVVLRRTEGKCLFCSAERHLIKFKGRLVCVDCIDIMGTEITVQGMAEHEGD